MPRSIDLLQGTLGLLIVETFTWGPAHRDAIARWIEPLYVLAVSRVLDAREQSI